MEFKRKVASGFVWHSAEKIAGTAFHAIISLLLARILAPADFGMVGMLVIFTAVSQALFDGGLSQALIRKENPSESDYTSVFGINVAGSAAVYALLILSTPLIARFYGQPELSAIAPILFLTIPVNALGSVHGAILFRTMRFRLSALVSLAAAVVSGAVAVALAVAGYGVWAIVVQMVLRDAVRVALLWRFGGWIPGRGCFSFAPIRSLLGFGGGMMVSGVLSQLSSNAAQLFIGRIYSPAALGLFYQSQKIKDTFVNALTLSVSDVTFPALSAIRGDTVRLRLSSRRVAAVMSFAMFPLLGGLIATAGDIFRTILTEKWVAAVPYFQLFCLSGFAVPAGTVALSVLKARGRGRLIMNIEIVKRAAMLLIIAVTVHVGIMAAVIGLAAYAYIETAVNIFYAARETGSGWRDALADALPPFALTAAMYAAVLLAGALPLGGGLLMLAAKVVSGAAVYLGLAALFRVGAWGEVRSLLRAMMPKRV